MSERSNRISRLLSSPVARAAYIRAKLSVLVPAQIRAARLKSTDPPMPTQKDLALESGMHQSRISMFETPGAANITLETLAKVCAGLRCGVIVKLVPMSEMLRWENSFSPHRFDVVPRLPQDSEFLNPSAPATGEPPFQVSNSGAHFTTGDNKISGTNESSIPPQLQEIPEKIPPASESGAGGLMEAGTRATWHK